jgi:hypothetical protein
MRNSIAATLTFGIEGNAASHQGAGWSPSEDRHTWATDARSQLCLDAPYAPHGFVLEVSWSPLLDPPFTPGQSVSIEVNGRPVARTLVVRGCVTGFLCPPPRRAESKLVVEFVHPDGICPAERFGHDDGRLLALAFHRVRVLVLEEPWRRVDGPVSDLAVVGADFAEIAARAEAAVGQPSRELFRAFEMLAGNCDMGLALRAMGHESLSLLRFGGALPDAALRGLDTGFAEIGSVSRAYVAEGALGEWMIEDAMGLRVHTAKSSLEMDQPGIVRAYTPHIRRLAAKFMEDVEAAEKVFVLADQRSLGATRGLETALPLHLALARRGGGRMLWVCPASGHNPPPGTAREVLPGLALAELDVLAPPSTERGGITISGWASVLVNAWHVFGLRA